MAHAAKKEYRIAVVIGAFHQKEAQIMLEEVRTEAKKYPLTIAEEIWVHGSLEKPLALKRALVRDDIDGAVALGIIERGETKHGFVMGQAVIASIINLQLETMKPVGVGILGPEILPEQIQPRLRPYAKEALIATAQMLGAQEM